MFTSLRLERFKSFRDSSVQLGPFFIAIGANSAGKSNIRDALRFLHGIGRGYNLAEIIGGKYGAGGQAEWSGIRGAAAELIHFGEDNFAITLRAYIKKRTFEYRIEVAQDDSARIGFRVAGESLSVGHRTIFTSRPGRYDPVDFQDDENHLLLRMEKTGNQRKYGLKITARHDEPAIVQIVEERRVVRTHKELILLFLEELSSIRFLDLVPDLMRKPSFPGQSILGDNGENLSTVLQGICSDPKREEILYDWIRELTPLDVDSFKFIKDPITGLIQFAIVEQTGHQVSAYSASDGTLRFLAMLAALLGENPASFYFFEEIDNGIHPARIKLLVDLIENVTATGSTQVMTTTHSPDMISMVSSDTFDKMAVVFRRDGSTFAEIRSAKDIPRLHDLKVEQSVSRLMAGGWFETVLNFDSDEEEDD